MLCRRVPRVTNLKVPLQVGTSQEEATDDPPPKERVSMGCCEVRSVFETVIYLASMGVHVLEMLDQLPGDPTAGAEEGYGSGGHEGCREAAIGRGPTQG